MLLGCAPQVQAASHTRMQSSAVLRQLAPNGLRRERFLAAPPTLMPLGVSDRLLLPLRVVLPLSMMTMMPPSCCCAAVSGRQGPGP